MRLISCHIEHFGRLEDVTIDFDERLHVVFGPNGWGKTTLAAFLRVMFYGFEGEGRRSDTDNERLYYRPWAGGVYGGSVSFDDGSGSFTVYRTFGTRKKQDTFRLTDNGTGLESGRYSSALGEELFGIDAASFSRSVFWGQLDLGAEVTAQIRAKIGNLDGEADDMSAYDDALRNLQRAIDRLSPDRAGGAIRRHRESLSALDAQLAGRPALEAREKDLAQACREQRDRVTNAAQSQAAQSSAGQASDAQASANAEAFRAYRRSIQALDEREQDLRRMGRDHLTGSRSIREELALQKRERAQRISSLQRREGAARAVLIISLLCALIVIAAAAAQAAPPSILWLLIPAAAAGCGAAAVILRTSDALQSLRQSPLPSDSLRDELSAHNARMREISAEIKDIQSQKANLRIDLPGTDTPGISASGEDLPGKSAPGSEARDAAWDIARLSAELEEVRSSLRDLDELEAQRDDIARTLETETRQREVAVLTRQYLEEARDSLTARYRPPFLRAFRRYYEILTGESAELILADASLSVSVMEAGMPRDPAQMSAGTRDLISLCRRLSMIEAMYPEQKPFLVMDDPFVNLDDDKLKGGLRLLRSASHDYQIIYLTCHQSRCPSSEDRP